MCTVTFIAREQGYALGMNRDEQRTRVQALPPRQVRAGGRAMLYPSEPTGGTWIGVNDSGVALALINWYSAPGRVEGRPVSRGEIVRAALPSTDEESIKAALRRLPLQCIRPFRLLGFFAREQAVREWQWDLHRLTVLKHDWTSHQWASSGLDEPGACRVRREVFLQASSKAEDISRGWLRKLHRSHEPTRGAYSICMHRADARTVSYTEIEVSPGRCRLDYQPGFPCAQRKPETRSIRISMPRSEQPSHPLPSASLALPITCIDDGWPEEQWEQAIGMQ
jgi:hypothetical protein